MKTNPDPQPEPRGLRFLAIAGARLSVLAAALVMAFQFCFILMVWLLRLYAGAFAGKQDAASQKFQAALDANTPRYAVGTGVMLVALLLLFVAQSNRWLVCAGCLVGGGTALWVGWMSPSDSIYLRGVVLGVGLACLVPALALWLPARSEQKSEGAMESPHDPDHPSV